MFKQQPCQKPVREKVQPYHILNPPAAVFICPGTKLFDREDTSRYIFPDEDKERINTAPYMGGKVLQHPEQGIQETGASVNRKHPKRGSSL